MIGLPNLVSDGEPFEQILARTAVSLTSKLDVKQTCDAILDAAERIFAARSSWILLHDAKTDELVICASRGSRAAAYADARIPANAGVVGAAFRRQETLFVADAGRERRWFHPDRIHSAGLESVFIAPLVYEAEGVGVIGIDAPRFSAVSPPNPIDRARLQTIAALAAVGLRNARLFQAAEGERARLERLVRERRELRSTVAHLRSEVRAASAHAAIVGDGPALRAVLEQIELVAPADSTVLMLGETGTGKELMARAIHDQSRRARGPFVAVNCAALPETLVESELFGHEKGAFTGAVARQPGKFELAQRGTLFLDEVGELPIAAQAKLLRVLQEREIVRLGSTAPVPVNVRLIAATNLDLTLAMQEGRFRADLFYRLSVFPIRLPALRERLEDLPALIQYFVRWFAERQHVPLPTVSAAGMASLRGYSWPGNIRELQNVIERSVLLARGRDITPELLALPSPAASVILPPTSPQAAVTHGATIPTFSDSERRAILMALESTGWRISGRNGAATVLGLKPTTLHAKMKKLGIRRPSGATG